MKVIKNFKPAQRINLAAVVHSNFSYLAPADFQLMLAGSLKLKQLINSIFTVKAVTGYKLDCQYSVGSRTAR